MNKKTVGVLEYDKIIQRLKEQAGSSMTKVVIEELRPSTDPMEIRERLAETDEAVTLITHKGPLPLGNFYPIQEMLSYAKKGGTLSPGELLRIRYNLKITRDVLAFLKSDLPPLPLMESLAELLVPFGSLEEEISRAIVSEEEISDHASKDLYRIRREKDQKNQAIKKIMDRLIRSPLEKDFLQEPIVSLREGRYVVPVKAQWRGKIPGIVHDQSASGATVFVEPQAVVHENNQLRQLENEEKQEIHRILSDFSQRLGEKATVLNNNQELLVHLDLICAKGKLSALQKGESPSIGEDRAFCLKEARHPLIDPREVVPIEVALGGTCRGLMITGPNTGGKTVTLKTCGLLAMMAQTGLHIPASSESTLPVFKEIFADIGDEQSIEQNLSTFSSHMANIISIVNQAGPDSLILLDELGAGTDPTEGAALAIAVVEDLLKTGSLVMATTHYTELKKYALSADRVENASMAFDLETLSPTYHLQMGIPGKSNAFAISEKLGLPQPFIEKAKKLLEGEDLKFEEVMERIEEDQKQAQAERDQAIALNIAIKKKEKEIEALLESTQRQREKVLDEAKEEARKIVGEVKDFSREVKEDLRSLANKESLGERNRGWDENRRKIKDAAGRYAATIRKKENRRPLTREEVEKGLGVHVVSLDQKGEVLSLPDDKGQVAVAIGALKVRVSVEDLTALDSSEQKKQRPSTNGGYRLNRKDKPILSTTLDVRGADLEEALIKVDQYLDRAFLGNVPVITIIHGKGTGVLMKGIRNHLKHHKQIAAYRKGSYHEGGDGVTIVEMEQN